MNRAPSAYLMCPGSQSARTCQDLSIAAICGLIPQPSTTRAATGPAPRYPSTRIARIGGFPLSGTIARPTTAKQASDLAWSAFQLRAAELSGSQFQRDSMINRINPMLRSQVITP